MRTLQRKISLSFVALAAFFLASPTLLFSAIIVDPDGVGATDVGYTDPATWTINSSAYIGNNGFGVLRVDNASLLYSSAVTLAINSDSIGVVTVDGNGTTWTADQIIQVGYSGNATLNITGGGKVYSKGGGISNADNCIARIDGAGSTWSDQGDFRVGNTLEVTGGGTMSSGSGTITSLDFGKTATVRIDGIGSTWTNSSYLYVGELANGALEITNGGTVSSGDCQIALDGNSTGSVIVDGISSTLNIDSYLYVGGIGIGDNPSKGTLEITNGGTVNSGGCDIAFYRGESTGSVIVDGIGSTLNIDSYLNIGGTGIVNNHGKDTLEITNGGLVRVGGRLGIDYYQSDDGGVINMATGGMLALKGDADNSLTDFLGLTESGTGIKYWDNDLADWADITEATYGEDFTLNYLTEGDLAGYTALTVGTVSVPEPSGLVLLLMGILLLTRCRRRRQWSRKNRVFFSYPSRLFPF